MTEPSFPGLILQDRPSIPSSSNPFISPLPPLWFLAYPTHVLSAPNPIQRDMDEKQTPSIDQALVETVFTSQQSTSSTSSTRILSPPTQDNSFAVSFPYSRPLRYRNESRFENDVSIHASKLIMWSTCKKQQPYPRTNVRILMNQKIDKPNINACSNIVLVT